MTIKFKGEQKEIKRGLEIVTKALSKKEVLPITKGVYVKVEDNKMDLMCNNLEISIEKQIAVEVEKGGAFVAPGQSFYNIIRELPSGEVNISVNDNKEINITAQNSDFTLKGFDAKEFPQTPEVEAESQITVPTELLLEKINKVVFAASNDETQPALNGVLFEIGQKQITLVATNTYRLAYAKAKIEANNDIDKEISKIIPQDTMKGLSKVIDNEEKITINVGESYISFTANNQGRLRFTSRIIEGNFPNYKQVIPQNKNISVKVDKVSFQQAVKRAYLIAKQDSGVGSLKCDTEKEKLFLNSTQDSGSVHEEIAMNDFKGDTVNIDFDLSYIEQALKTITKENINIELIGPINPLVIKEEDNDDYFYLVMPVRPNAI
ncbi:MAG: DNA polymerase III subunit beta [bacterium]